MNSLSLLTESGRIMVRPTGTHVPAKGGVPTQAFVTLATEHRQACYHPVARLNVRDQFTYGLDGPGGLIPGNGWQRMGVLPYQEVEVAVSDTRCACSNHHLPWPWGIYLYFFNLERFVHLSEHRCLHNDFPLYSSNA